MATMAAAQPSYQDHHCDNQVTTLDMNICANLAFKEVDGELNKLWNQLVTEAKRTDHEFGSDYEGRPSTEVSLRKAQRAWIQFRDAQCTFEMSEAGGSPLALAMTFNSCLARLTDERIVQLRPTDTDSH
jgi:uncharacterized protein YecT (DUF1311 family)